MSQEHDTDVLIVGAGPTGLVLALCLQRFGVRFRIVDKAPTAGTTSRALLLHARTLEFYRQLGLANAVIEAAQKVRAVNLWVGGRVRGRMPFGDIGARMSLYPFSLIFPQDEHERVLVDALHARGVCVERSIDVTAMTLAAGGAIATLRHDDGRTENCRARYVAGCDGAHSIVREMAHVALPGGTYDHLWFVADVDATGPLVNQEINVSMSTRDALAVMPMKGAGAARLVGQAAAEAGGGAVTWESVSSRMSTELNTHVRNVRWFSTYRVHHRVASAFRSGPAFLLGDSAHLHSPVGGQGMNTGIGDAVNLAWKLAMVLRGAGSPSLLDTYEAERIAFAHLLVATTDRVFSLLNGSSLLARLFRTVVAPGLMPQLLRFRAGRGTAFRVLSQISINYRRSALSKGRAGKIHGGDRLPWIDDNFTVLDAMAWQAHVYGTASARVRAACAARGLPLHEFAWTDDARGAGFERDALYVVRPDGHVGLAASRGEADLLTAYVPAYDLTAETNHDMVI